MFSAFPETELYKCRFSDTLVQFKNPLPALLMTKNLEYNMASHSDFMGGDSHPPSGIAPPGVAIDPSSATTLRSKRSNDPPAIRVSLPSKDQANIVHLLAKTNQASLVNMSPADQVSKQLCFFANLIRYRKAAKIRINPASLTAEANHSLSFIHNL
jgi:hypothetical protein